MEKDIIIQLVQKNKNEHRLDDLVTKHPEQVDEAEDDEVQEKIFAIKIVSGEPEGLKISKKNTCIVKILD